jgi:hypothetical protein
MQPKPLISVVVPCSNEHDVLPPNHQRLVDTLGSRPDIDLGIVYVDDGGVDSTSTILDQLAPFDL